MTISAAAIGDLAPTGVLRAAINLGNPALARIGEGGEPCGRSVDLARALARRLGVPVSLVRFESAGGVVAAAASDGWDIAFLAVDPARAVTLRFSSPYLTIETGIVVPAAAPLATVADIDRPGLRIATAAGAAYEHHLRRTLTHAAIRSCKTPTAALALLEAGGADCAAGVRQALATFVGGRPGFRVLAGVLATVQQAIVTHPDRPAGAAFVEAFLEEGAS